MQRQHRIRPTPLEQSITDPHLRFLRTIREYELDRASVYFPSPVRADGYPLTILEVGAGTGQQAESLSRKGYKVVAIDLPSSHYRDDRVFDVAEYDGRNIPMADKSADVVFSSNVLEHIDEIDAFLEETRRVLRDGGVAVHVLPSSACRFWGIPAHYAWLVRRVFALVASAGKRRVAVEAGRAPRIPRSAGAWWATIFPARHGERGNTLSEVYYFSRYWWRRKFQENGFTVVRIQSNGVFYTMANGLADSVGLKVRNRLAAVLGSACHIYVLQSSKC